MEKVGLARKQIRLEESGDPSSIREEKNHHAWMQELMDSYMPLLGKEEMMTFHIRIFSDYV